MDNPYIITETRILFVYKRTKGKDLFEDEYKVGELFTTDEDCIAMPTDAAKEFLARQSYGKGMEVVYAVTAESDVVCEKTNDKISISAQDVYDDLKRQGAKISAKHGDKDLWIAAGLDTIKNTVNRLKQLQKTEGNVVIRFRPEQQDAIGQAETQFRKNKDKPQSFLWNAKMRFGKTLCALEVARDEGYTRTLIVTHRPVVDEGWHDDFNKIFSDPSKNKNGLRYEYASRMDDNKKEGQDFYALVRGAEQGEFGMVYFVSMQFLRLSTEVGGENDDQLKRDILNYDWQYVIVDEAHEGTKTERGQNVLKTLKKATTRILSLSGTPFNLLDDFKEGEIYTWDYVKEQKAKRDWDKDNYGDPNPYAVLPQINIFTFDLASQVKENNMLDENQDFKFSSFFRTWTHSVRHNLGRKLPSEEMVGRFIFEDEVNGFLDQLIGNTPDSIYPFAREEFRNEFRHTLWILPGVRECKAMKALLDNHSIFQDFEVVNVAGDGIDELTEEPLEEVKKNIRINPYTITLSCGRLTTGVSVPEWTAVLYLKGSENTTAATYMQTIFRVQTHASLDGRPKRQCYVFDFAPNRALRVIVDTARQMLLADDTKDKSKKADNIDHKEEKEAVDRFLEFSNLKRFEGGRFNAYEPHDVFVQLKQVYIERAVTSGYADNSIYDQNKLLQMSDGQFDVISWINNHVGATKRNGQKTTIDIGQKTDYQGGTAEPDDTDDSTTDNDTGKNKPEKSEEQQRHEEEMKRKGQAMAVLRSVAIRIPLLVYGAEIHDENRELSIDNFTTLVDDASWAEFMPAGFAKPQFDEIKNLFSEEVFLEAGKRIRALARAADEMDVEERIDRIATIFSYFRNPDKETVLTPWPVVNRQLSDTLGGWCFYDDTFKHHNMKEVDDGQGGKAMAETIMPRFVDRGEVTKNVFGYDSHVLEINSKSGLYPLYMAYSMYLQAVKPAYNDNELLDTPSDDLVPWDQILDENIFVITRTPMAASITRRTLAGFRKDVRMNVWCYKHKFTVGQLVKAKVLKNDLTLNKDEIRDCDIVDVLRVNPQLFINDVANTDFWKDKTGYKHNMNGSKKLKFNAIVGNPPYQESKASELTKSNAAFASAIYPYFIDACLKIEPAYISLITPSRWMTRVGQGISDEWVTKMLSSNEFICMHDFINATDCFDNVEIKGGVNYFLISKDYKGKCKYILHQNGNAFANNIYLDSIGAGVVIRDANAINIIEKVSQVEGHYFNNKSFSMLVSPKHYFDKGELLSTNWMGYSKIKDSNHPVKFYLNRRLESEGYGWIKESDIPRNKQTLSLNKVFIPEAGGSGSDSIILGTPFFGEPNSVCSYTYLVIAYEQKEHLFTQEECFNIISYIKTCFFRYMVSIKKKTQHNPRDVFQFVPLQDFTSSSDIDWTQSVADIDRQLYRKYGLSDEEVAFIEKMIKPME